MIQPLGVADTALAVAKAVFRPAAPGGGTNAGRPLMAVIWSVAGTGTNSVAPGIRTSHVPFWLPCVIMGGWSYLV